MATNKDFAKKALEFVGQGPTKFRTWYYGRDLQVDWCAVWVSYVANEIGILNKIVKKCEGAGDFPREGVKAGWGTWHEGHNTIPEIGDIPVFCWNGKGRDYDHDKYYSNHVGVVTKVKNSRVYTAEGNINGSNNNTTVVGERSYPLFDGVINGYYRPNWNAVKKTTVVNKVVNKLTGKTTKPDVIYRVKAGGKWLPEVKNLADFAGVVGKPITDVAIKVTKGSVKYRVHIKGGGWLPYVTGYNIKDHNNGYAGNGKVIDAIEIYYSTPSDYSKKNGYLKAKYRVSPLKGNYYSYQYDNEKSNGQDGYAGDFGKSIDRLQITLD